MAGEEGWANENEVEVEDGSADAEVSEESDKDGADAT